MSRMRFLVFFYNVFFAQNTKYFHCVGKLKKHVFLDEGSLWSAEKKALKGQVLKNGFRGFLCYPYIEMKKPQKTPKHFHCKKCGFTSRNKKDYTRHLSTTKHKMDNMDNIKSNAKNPRRAFECVCGKIYKYNSGLSKHRKKCTLNSKEENIKNIETSRCIK